MRAHSVFTVHHSNARVAQILKINYSKKKAFDLPSMANAGVTEVIQCSPLKTER